MFMSNSYIGSKFDDFLEDDDLLAQCQAEAIKRVLAWQINEYLERTHKTKSELAKALDTSRSALDRLTNPKNTSVNLNTLAKVAEVMGKKLELRLV